MTTLDEERTADSDHGFELHNAHSIEIVEEAHSRSLAQRRTFATLAVAVCLGGAGIIIGLAMVQGQRSSDERATREALEREELRDGWKALGAAATEEAQRVDVPPVAPQPAVTGATSTAAPPATNFVVVNVPAAQPAAPGAVVVTPSVPSGNYSPTPPRQSLASDANPVVTYVPVPAVAPTATGGGLVIPDRNVGNGTIPGSAPNPALPNGGSAIAPPSVPVPSGGATPLAPVGAVPVPPPTTTLP